MHHSTEKDDNSAKGALRSIIEHFLSLHPAAGSLGFSDDDAENVEEVRALFKRLERDRPRVTFKVYKVDTPPVSPIFSSKKPYSKKEEHYGEEGDIMEETKECECRERSRSPAICARRPN
jgi:hypothetical protein